MRQELKLPSRASSLKLLHKGEGEGLKEARESLVFEEFFLFHFRMMLFKSLTQEEKKERAYLPPEEAPEPFESALKMSLTCDQRRAFQEIGKDMASPVAMQRLLQGDVGSGKTLVALLAAFHPEKRKPGGLPGPDGGPGKATLLQGPEDGALQAFPADTPLREPPGAGEAENLGGLGLR